MCGGQIIHLLHKGGNGMKQFFSESYSKVCVGTTHEQLEMGWQGIEAYCEKDEIVPYQLVLV